MKKVKRRKPSPLTESYREYLHKTKDYLMVQRGLLASVLYWYILPCFVLILVFLAGFLEAPGNVDYVVRTASLSFVFGVIIYFLNRMAIKRQITPRIEKIEKLISELDQ